MKDVACKHCYSMAEPHRYVCHCGHTHNEHSFAGGCTKCKCSQYDQREQLTAEAWKEEKEKEKKKEEPQVAMKQNSIEETLCRV